VKERRTANASDNIKADGGREARREESSFRRYAEHAASLACGTRASRDLVRVSHHQIILLRMWFPLSDFFPAPDSFDAAAYGRKGE